MKMTPFVPFVILSLGCLVLPPITLSANAQIPSLEENWEGDNPESNFPSQPEPLSCQNHSLEAAQQEAWLLAEIQRLEQQQQSQETGGSFNMGDFLGLAGSIIPGALGNSQIGQVVDIAERIMKLGGRETVFQKNGDNNPIVDILSDRVGSVMRGNKDDLRPADLMEVFTEAAEDISQARSNQSQPTTRELEALRRELNTLRKACRGEF